MALDWHCHAAVAGLAEFACVQNCDSNADLTYKFQQMLKAIGDCSPNVPIAIVPIEKGQWSAVINSKLRREYPDCIDRIQAVERRLRGLYVLHGN